MRKCVRRLTRWIGHNVHVSVKDSELRASASSLHESRFRSNPDNDNITIKAALLQEKEDWEDELPSKEKENEKKFNNKCHIMVCNRIFTCDLLTNHIWWEFLCCEMAVPTSQMKVPCEISRLRPLSAPSLAPRHLGHRIAECLRTSTRDGMLFRLAPLDEWCRSGNCLVES